MIGKLVFKGKIKSVRVSGVMEIPHGEHNSRKSVRRLTCSKTKH